MIRPRRTERQTSPDERGKSRRDRRGPDETDKDQTKHTSPDETDKDQTRQTKTRRDKTSPDKEETNLVDAVDEKQNEREDAPADNGEGALEDDVAAGGGCQAEEREHKAQNPRHNVVRRQPVDSKLGGGVQIATGQGGGGWP